MLRKAFFAIALVASLTSSALAVTTISAGNHVFTVNSGLQTFAITASSDSGETLQGIDLYAVMDALGPIITNVNLITGTVFDPNNVGQFDYAMPENMVPTREPAYYTTTASNSVPTGIVAFLTIDTNSALAGQYTLSLDSPLFGPSAVYNQTGAPGGFANGSVTLVPVPEPSTIVMGLFGAAGLAAVAIRRRRARA